jgi:hypothetical protein
MNHAELFYLDDAGIGRWVVKHRITDERAGDLVRTPSGLILRDDEASMLGRFKSVDDALDALYATA